MRRFKDLDFSQQLVDLTFFYFNVKILTLKLIGLHEIKDSEENF